MTQHDQAPRNEATEPAKACGCGPDCRCGPGCACRPNGKCAPACTCDE